MTRVKNRSYATSSAYVSICARPRHTPCYSNYPVSMRLRSPFSFSLLRPAALFFTSTACALAHHEPAGLQEVDEFAEPAFQAAFTHSFTGVDHLLAAFAVGWICTGGSRGRSAGLVVSFLTALAAGTFSAVGLAPFPGMEAGIAVSLLLLAFALRHDQPATRALAYPVIAVTGLWHGLVHGSEFSPAAPAAAGVAGLLLGNAAVISAMAALTSTAYSRLPVFRRAATALLALSGSWLLFCAS